MSVVTMDRKIEKVIVLDSSNHISYWADVSKYEDKAKKNVSGRSLMEEG